MIASCFVPQGFQRPRRPAFKPNLPSRSMMLPMKATIVLVARARSLQGEIRREFRGISWIAEGRHHIRFNTGRAGAQENRDQRFALSAQPLRRAGEPHRRLTHPSQGYCRTAQENLPGQHSPSATEDAQAAGLAESQSGRIARPTSDRARVEFNRDIHRLRNQANREPKQADHGRRGSLAISVVDGIERLLRCFMPPAGRAIAALSMLFQRDASTSTPGIH